MQNIAVKPPTQRHVPVTVEMYHLMAERGAFHPEDRVELVGGRIFDMSPVGSLHARCVNILNALLIEALGRSYIVSIQNPIILDDESEPEPDVCLLLPMPDSYKNSLPKAPDVKLVIEVADTSIEFDRVIKFQRYAHAGIREAWLVDLINDRVEVHYAPKESAYSRSKIFQRGENVVAETIPEISLSVDEILG